MKKLLSTAFIFLFVITAAGTATAAESFDQSNGWSEDVYSGTASFTPSGQTMGFFFEDDPATNQAWAMWYKSFPSAYGALATFKVTSFNGSDVAAGMRKYVGLTTGGPFSTSSGNPILAGIYLQVHENEYRISYRVRERTTNYVTVKYLARGVLGDWDGMWQLGEKVTIGIAAVGNDIYFYSPKVEAFTKVQLLDGMSPVTSKWTDIEVCGWVWNTDGDITGEVSDFTPLQ